MTNSLSLQYKSVLDDIVERILRIVFRYHENHDANAVWDMDADHEIARQITQETMVLLKNEDILPLSSDKKIAFIGKYAKKHAIRVAAVPIFTAEKSLLRWMPLKNMAM